MASVKLENIYKKYDGNENYSVKDVSLYIPDGSFAVFVGPSGCGDSDIMMTDTINPLKSKFKGFHKTFKQDDLGLSLSSFLLN